MKENCQSSFLLWSSKTPLIYSYYKRIIACLQFLPICEFEHCLFVKESLKRQDSTFCEFEHYLFVKESLKRQDSTFCEFEHCLFVKELLKRQDGTFCKFGLKFINALP